MRGGEIGVGEEEGIPEWVVGVGGGVRVIDHGLESRGEEGGVCGCIAHSGDESGV